MTQSASSTAAALAAIDMGSNSFRLEVATLQQGRYRRVDYLKQTVRLGAGLDAQGLLTEDAVQRGLDCLQHFAARLAGFDPGRIRAVATQTLREARNRDDFLHRAQAALGHPIDVISGREEARLIYAGVAQLQPSDVPQLVIDIGGRSTELILGRGRTPVLAESFAVGCVSLSLRYFPDGAVSAGGFRDAQVAAGAEFEEATALFAPAQWQQALGSSGTAGAVSQLLQAAGVSDGTITPAALRWCIERCVEARHVERLQLPSLKADRRAVLPGGLAILYTLLAQFGITELKPARGALRQGVIVDLHERLLAARHEQPGDMRDASVAALQRRFGVDVEQAARVRAIALTLFDSAWPEADAEARRELGWACDLHEIGLMVSHHDHHRHSAYLLSHVDAPGFAQGEQRRIGALVLGQRGGLKKVEALLDDQRFAGPLLCLRLAVIKCHGREAVDIGALRLRLRGDEAQLRFSRAWATDRLRTLHLLREEQGHWSRPGVLRLELTKH